jgi:hypothetical protein
MGKKIVSMNAVKHGMYTSPSLESMAVLQENPLEYVKLLAGLIGSFHPRNGNMIRTLFEQLELETGAAGAEAGETEGPAAASMLSERQQRLLEMLSEESEDGGEEWHNYSKQQVEITPALRGSLYAPGPEDWPLLREQALVDGLLVRKFKLLLEMQRERRRAAAEEGEVEWDLSSVKLKEPQPEGGGSSRAPDPAGGSGAQAAPAAAPGGGPQAEGCRRSEALTRKGSAVQGGPTALPEASVDQFGARPARPNHPAELGSSRVGPKPSVHTVAKTVEEKKANDKRQKQPAPSAEAAEEGMHCKTFLTEQSYFGRQDQRWHGAHRMHCKIFLTEQSYRSRSKQRIGVRRLGEQTYQSTLCLRLAHTLKVCALARRRRALECGGLTPPSHRRTQALPEGVGR